MSAPRRASRRAYNRVSNVSDNVGISSGQDDDVYSSERVVSTTTDTGTDKGEECHSLITIIVLDSAQSRFPILASPDWTVDRFKEVGAEKHRVAPPSQRLIYRGKLLNSGTSAATIAAEGEEGSGGQSPPSKTLRDFGITENDTIVHLFPKPQVVVVNESGRAPSSNSNNAHNNRPNGGGSSSVELDGMEEGGGGGEQQQGGAHIPQIVLDAEEAERRQNILILSSTEIYEAQHHVKLLSLLLLVMSAMELLTLMTIMLGGEEYSNYDDIPPGEPTDTFSGGGSGANQQIRTWQNSDYFDLIVSAFCFYVATLGIKATTENTLALARWYFGCLIISGFGWVGYYYYITVRDEEKAEESSSGDSNSPSSGDDDADIYSQAFVSLLIPILVWTMCFLRAWQFQSLIHQAELEAQERVLELETGEEQQQHQQQQQQQQQQQTDVENQVVVHDQELSLQVADDERRNIT